MRAPGTNTATVAPVVLDEVITEAWLNATQDIPSYAPLSAKHSYDSNSAAYNRRGSTLHKIHALEKKLVANTAPLNGLWMGDSTGIGYNGSSYVYADAIPRQMGRTIASLLGVPYYNGIEQALKAQGAPGDTTVVTGGFVNSTYPHFLSCNGAGTAVWTSTDPGTAVEFYYSDLSTTNFTYQVDGGGTTAVTTNASATIKKVTVTGLSFQRHKIQINGVTGSGNYVFIFGWRCYTPGQNAFYMHNMSIGGARANSGTAAGQNWSNTTTASGGGLGYTAPATWAAAGVTPDFGVICIGNNDIGNGSVPAATIAQGIRNMKAYLPSGAPVILAHPPRVNGTDSTVFDALGTQFFVLADEFDAMYFDWNDWDYQLASYQSDGLAGSDNIHPLRAEQYGVGRHMGNLVADWNPTIPGLGVIEGSVTTEMLAGTWNRITTSGSATTVTLTAAPFDGAEVVVENVSAAGLPNVLVQRGGSDTIEGSTATFALQPGEFGTYTYRAATGTWFQRRALAAATPGTLMRRDQAGRAQVALPAASGDITNKGYVDLFPVTAFAALSQSATIPAGLGGTYYQVDTSGGSVTITLPSISSMTPGQMIVISKWDVSANSVAIVLGNTSDKLNNVTNGNAFLTVAYENTQLVASASGWTQWVSGIGDPSVFPNVLVQRDSAGRSKFADPSAAQDAATKNYVDTKVAGVTGGTATATTYATLMKFGVD